MPLTPVNRVGFMMAGLGHCILPRGFYSIGRVLRHLTPGQLAEAERRADYYCRQALNPSETTGPLLTASGFRLPRTKPRHTTYFFPTRRFLNYFPQNLRFAYAPGDIYDPFAIPTLTKARLIGDANATLLPLDAIRHFRYVTSDPTPWRDKKDILMSRNEVHRKARIPFMTRWFGHPRTDLGQVNPQGGRPDLWLKPRISIDEQLNYKFIACIEGNDVATNLKWVMSSNSLPVMPRPTMETWFMEGTLQPDVNYVALTDDFENLLVQMDFYLSHPAEAEEMIRRNHEYIRRFRNPDVELAVALLTLQRYFKPQLQI